MKRLIDRRPNPATFISCIALFVSLGGVSYGVSTGFIDSREIKDETIRSKDVRNNSLRTQDIHDNEIRSRDIRNSTIIGRDVGLNSLTQVDILESSLSRVPEAKEADLLDGIDSTGFVRSDAAGFGALPIGPAGTSAIGEPPPGFDVDPVGYVHLQGVIEVGAPLGPIAILPVGSRPDAERRFAVYGDPVGATPAAPTLVRVRPDGEVRPEDTAAVGDQIALDGITFRVGG